MNRLTCIQRKCEFDAPKSFVWSRGTVKHRCCPVRPFHYFTEDWSHVLHWHFYPLQVHISRKERTATGLALWEGRTHSVGHTLNHWTQLIFARPHPIEAGDCHGEGGDLMEVQVQRQIRGQVFLGRLRRHVGRRGLRGQWKTKLL